MKKELFESILSSENKLSKTAFFEALIKEDCCASDFSGFVPEKVITLEKKKEENKNED